MLGYILGCAAWGFTKAHVLGAHRTGHMLEGYAMPELVEELQFRGLAERVVAPAVGLSPGAARLAQAAYFGSMHPGNELDAAVGGFVYSMAFAKHGLLGSLGAHVAHNIGCWLGSK